LYNLTNQYITDDIFGVGRAVMRKNLKQTIRRPLVFGVVALLIVGLGAWIFGWWPFARHDAVEHCPAGQKACYTESTIGASVQGRPITAYQFGDGREYLIYIGGMHGNEANSTKLMEQWRDELAVSLGRIPGDRSVVVIPAANPDGLAAGLRLNANQVDLNRNFPAKDWKQSVTLPARPDPTNAGGTTPLSEPESKAIAEYLEKKQARLIISFHSRASIVEANGTGDSVAVAAMYAAKTQYEAVSSADSKAIFQYDTTGAMEDWLRDRPNKPAILVELASDTDSEFERNKDALWSTIEL
jgi:predicted deacylase